MAYWIVYDINWQRNADNDYVKANNADKDLYTDENELGPMFTGYEIDVPNDIVNVEEYLSKELDLLSGWKHQSFLCEQVDSFPYFR